MRRQIFLEGKGGASELNNGGSINLKLGTVDVSAKDYKYKYVIEHSYTKLDAMFFKQYINIILDDKDKDKKLIKVFKKMSTDHIQRLVHNIFPREDEIFGNSSNCNTLLHFLAMIN